MQEFEPKEILNMELPSQGLEPILLTDGESYNEGAYKLHALADTTFTTLSQNEKDWSSITLSDTDEIKGNWESITVNTGTLAVYPRP